MSFLGQILEFQVFCSWILVFTWCFHESVQMTLIYGKEKNTKCYPVANCNVKSVELKFPSLVHKNNPWAVRCSVYGTRSNGPSCLLISCPKAWNSRRQHRGVLSLPTPGWADQGTICNQLRSKLMVWCLTEGFSFFTFILTHLPLLNSIVHLTPPVLVWFRTFWTDSGLIIV